MEFGSGWDNTAFLVNEAWVFRFPRRQLGVTCLGREVAALPLIADRVTVPVPRPVFVGRPVAEFPWPFAGYRVLPGVTLERASGSRLEVAASLGRFLRRLHSLEVPASGDDLDRLGEHRREDALKRLEGLLGEVPRLVEILDARVGLVARDDVLVHGDLYCRHLLVEEGRLSGVIDWGDVHRGHAATDLGAAFVLFRAEEREEFFSAYGPVDDETVALARYRGLTHSLAVAAYAEAVGDRPLLAEALAGLDRL